MLLDRAPHWLILRAGEKGPSALQASARFGILPAICCTCIGFSVLVIYGRGPRFRFPYQQNGGPAAAFGRFSRSACNPVSDGHERQYFSLARDWPREAASRQIASQ